MRVCGLTGGVGMGKSTAAGFFSQRGACIVDTDVIARQLVRPGQPALSEIQKLFGAHLVGPDGELRRDELAGIVFADRAAREKLEAVLHPRIRENWSRQIGEWRRENRPLALVVIPLLFETKAETLFEKIICVACSAPTQHERLRERGWSATQIRQRIAAQMSAEQKIAGSDFVIWTEGLPAVHDEQVARIAQQL